MPYFSIRYHVFGKNDLVKNLNFQVEISCKLLKNVLDRWRSVIFCIFMFSFLTGRPNRRMKKNGFGCVVIGNVCQVTINNVCEFFYYFYWNLNKICDFFSAYINNFVSLLESWKRNINVLLVIWSLYILKILFTLKILFIMTNAFR